MQLRISDDDNSIVAAILLIKVRGDGIIYVRYSKDDDTNNDNIMIYLDLKDISLADEEWHILKIPFTMRVHDPMQHYHYIRIGNVGVSTGALNVDDVIIYVDDHRCPVLACNKPTKQVFVNGYCEPGSQSDMMCPLGKIHTGCFLKETGITQNCSTSFLRPIKDQVTIQDAGGYWELAPEECTWICLSGFWYSRALGLAGRPMCKLCTPIAQLECQVGWCAVGCTDEHDAKCVPCDILDRYDNSVVYTSKYNKTMYTLPPTEQCTHACSPGQF
jgi:hypothetical protein